MTACWFVLWHLTHRFRGLDHDGHLYALQALARLRPDLYSNDIFFRFGSQDSFTIFTMLYAPVVSWLGVDGAASLLTFLATTALFVASWALARKVAGRELAWLSVGLLIVLEIYYGGFDVFKVGEEFLTARLPAEALGIGAIALALSGRWLVASVLAALAAMIHPLMATPIIGILILLLIPDAKRTLLLLTGGIATIIALGIGWWTPVGPICVIDDTWLEIINARSYYLFPMSWTAASWSRMAVYFVTLWLGVRLLPDAPGRKLAVATGIVGATGVLLAFVTEAAPLQLLVQGQPWRWLWPAGVIAVIAVPTVVHRLWAGINTERTAAALLAASWLTRETSGGLLAFAAISLALMPAATTQNANRLLSILRWCTGIMLAIWIASSAALMVDWNLHLGQEPAGVEMARALLGFSPLALVIALFLWSVAFRSPPWAATMLGIAVLAGWTFMAKSTLESWTRHTSDPARAFDTFAQWRGIVPVQTEVLWLWNPLPTWLLLQRPSYLSLSQGAGLLFSRPLALEIDRRARTMHGLGDRDWLIVGGRAATAPRPLSAQSLREICGDTQLGFVVAPVKLDFALDAIEWPRKGEFVWLYDCRSQRIDTVTPP
jgi:hypothetical protein